MPPTAQTEAADQGSAQSLSGYGECALASGDAAPSAAGEHPGVHNLRTCQRQLDADGCEVGVSRQALDETLAVLDGLLEALKGLDRHARESNWDEIDSDYPISTTANRDAWLAADAAITKATGA